MTTKSLRVASAAVIGARHARDARNGQDAAGAWVESPRSAAIVVCDGCGSGGSSEVGARLAARAVLGAIASRLQHSERATNTPTSSHSVTATNAPTNEPTNAPMHERAIGQRIDAAFWDDVRAAVVAYLRDVARSLPGELEDVVHDFLLFTIVAAVVVDDTAHIWAIGDGAFAIDGVVREIGPFANNQPPYIAYDLIGTPAGAYVESARVRRSVLVATDGAAELDLARIAADPAAFVANPDALRRYLAKQAKSEERIDWHAQRVIRTPAPLQDDGAIALILREASTQSDADAAADGSRAAAVRRWS